MESPELPSPGPPPTTNSDDIKELLDELEGGDEIEQDIGQIKRQFMSRIMPEDEEFNSSQVPIDTITKREVQDLIESIPKPLIQKPFQPGSSPTDEDNRFLCWNNTGIIRAQYTTTDQSIDVMFHDTEKHSSLNFKNEPNYTFGSISEDCVVVATNGKYGTGPSSIHGMNLVEMNRDNREWEVELPHVELVEALAAGIGFVAVATDQRVLRLFTNAGMQSYLFTLPGQILCITAHEKQLMIVYHDGTGHSDDQNLSMFIYHIDLFNNIIRQIYGSIPVALGKRSPLSWAGFSDEGTPFTYDYSGMLRVYRNQLWIPILDLRGLTSSALDHYFVVGVNEISQVVKAVKCKRSRYPDFSTEISEMLSFSLPMCEMETDKGRLEEEHIRLRLAEYSFKQSAQHEALEANEKSLVNNLLRLFAMYLKDDKEEQARNLVYMMPRKYMSKLAEFAWKTDRPQYFIESLNRAIEEREQIDLELKVDEDDRLSVSSVISPHKFAKDLRKELKYSHSSPDKLKPIPLDKLMTNNRIDNEKRLQPDDDESGDENNVKCAKRMKSINHNIFSKKRSLNA